ncbi:single-stranded-DNA-specific exonuclease RecJ [Ameyamaea chiangmaiensis NBRC 103196]|uniref:Single-stranded-DNA-specific exonuclease RecJ n=1 Tax=Ameyamaea chiangmaiensis TaxID=442969 RepID=A0A850PF62_9PROT|nr:single-stranded-DNA-specific exonuclease RecJ [Ameyamaea chiangmaiensis]MBS4075652.1 single-stranded-DNA-specific exonuclease RecJ [Ameyamaea chiangmaiensis]NVN41473.1 single-stranded-DNA-specific exonuclease RecJ [Ameyamaea chiangmaiensis]GBQ70641.1 single-stranded-DNA-specific exonuclease RecJ [Ameyamaea chiangmaiensis NBRC 103196]
MVSEVLETQDDACVLNVTRSLSGRRWLWREHGLAPDGVGRTALAIAQRAGLPEIVARILASRGVGADHAADFLDPTLRVFLPDPSRFADMDAAVARLVAAVAARETVAVFGDYDVDGACASAILTLVLRALGCDVRVHIPDRLAEGYGPNAGALARLIDDGATLVVCVDCGTTAPTILNDAARRADVVVLDHHKAEGPLPRVTAVVNPNRPDCASGHGMICAATLSFLTCVGLLRALRRAGRFADTPPPDLLGLLDLVALATICDVMPLNGLNRALVTQGLKVMRGRQRVGIAALLDVAGVLNAPDAFSCGFALGPRINAGGRIAEADLGVRLLLSTDEGEARVLAERLDAINRRRQTVESAILDPALEEAGRQRDEGRAVLFVHGSAWHSGVVGIVAGRIKERFNRPALVGAEADGVIKGSARSVPGLDIGSAILAAHAHGLLLTGGGHAMAAGFSLSVDKAQAFHAFLDERLTDARALPPAVDVLVDGVLAGRGATIDLAADLRRLAPFGAGHDEPMMVLSRVRVVKADRIGRDGNTLRVLLESATGGTRVKALLFRAEDKPFTPALEDRAAPLLHVAGWLRAEQWNGRESIGFFIHDAALA